NVINLNLELHLVKQFFVSELLLYRNIKVHILNNNLPKLRFFYQIIQLYFLMGLLEISTKPPEKYIKEPTKKETKKLLKKLKNLQKVLYAQGKYSILIILQGLDASGKDGAINKVFSGLNPLVVDVKAFKAPTEEEKNHDFLWRVHPHPPRMGEIMIFNRPPYEDVLVPVVL